MEIPQDNKFRGDPHQKKHYPIPYVLVPSIDQNQKDSNHKTNTSNTKENC